MLNVAIVVVFAVSAPTQEHELDRCLGDRPGVIKGADIERTWRGLLNKQKPAPLKLRALSAGQCVSSWWTPVTPETAQDVRCDGRRMFLSMPGISTIVVDIEKGTWSLRKSNDSIEIIDGETVTRPIASARADGGPFTLTTPRGDVVMPGYPEHFLGDRAVLQLKDRAVVVDKKSMKTLFPLAARPGGEVGVVATQMVPGAVAGFTSTNGATTSAEAFVVDDKGALLASVTDTWPARVAYPQKTSDGAGIVLAAWHAGAVEVVLVRDSGKVERRTVAVADLDEKERGRGGAVLVAGAGHTVAVGLGRRLLVVRLDHPDEAAVRFDKGLAGATFESIAPLAVLDGGNVVTALVQDGSGRSTALLVSDTKNGGTELARAEYVGVVDDGRVLLMRERTSKPAEEAIVIRADGSVTRGPMGVVDVGRFKVESIGGFPLGTCLARALSILPPLVRYPGPPESEGGYLLPDALVK